MNIAIIRDIDTNENDAAAILENLSLPSGQLMTLGQENNPISELKTECVIYIAVMSHGCLGYQKKFFERHRDIPLWCVLLLNQDETTRNILDECFRSDGLRRQIITITPQTDWEALSLKLSKLVNTDPRMALIHSLKPGCGKKTLAKLLSIDLPDWRFITSDGSSTIHQTNAGKLIIAGESLSDLQAVNIPEDIEPFYVLTKPDCSVQDYLARNELHNKIMEMGITPSVWTESSAKQHCFYVSPLYEGWRRSGTVPLHDERFIMWDRFGLPCKSDEYTDENIQAFISQFKQCEELSEALKNL